MNDDKIFKICIITSIVGLLGVIILSGYVSPEKLSIDEIDNSKIDNDIEVDATITNIITTKTGTRIVTLNDGTSSINLVIFASTITNFNLDVGKKVSVTAKVTVYNGQLELILEQADNIKESNM